MLTKNGFSLPLHPFQVLSWIIELWHVTVPIFFTARDFHSPGIVCLYILFYLSSIIVILAGFLATKSIPSIDLNVEPPPLETGESITFYCTVCSSYVTKTSKHCGRCDRCVEGFDHHCKWLNNCIGKKNYALFIFLIFVLDFNILVLFIIEMNSVIQVSEYKYGILIVDSIFNLTILIFVSYLILFHFYLKCKKITTYEYIKLRKIQSTKKVSIYKATQEAPPSATISHRFNPPNSPVRRSCMTIIQKEREFPILHSLSQEELVHSISFKY